jgi:hypothetical protein
MFCAVLQLVPSEVASDCDHSWLCPWSRERVCPPDDVRSHSPSPLHPRVAESTPGHQADESGADLAATETGQAPETRAATDRSTDAPPGPPDRPELSEADVGESLSPEAERFQALETENAQARQKIADLEAKNDEQAARIEQLLASTDRRPGETTTPERGADEPAISPDQDAKSLLLAENKNPRDEVADTNDSTAAHTRLRRAVSADTFGTAATLIDATDTIRLVAMHATPGEVMIGLAATALGLVSLGLAKAEQHRKEKK